MPTQDVHNPVRVLLVEDSLDDERLALRALRGCGRSLAVQVARDGLRARQALGFDDEPGKPERQAFDLVVSDLKLPGLDGHNLLCLVRNDARMSRIPYVVFSSSNEERDVERCLERGADAFVQKPVGYETFLDCLQRVTAWALDGFSPSDAPPCVVGVSPNRREERRAA